MSDPGGLKRRKKYEDRAEVQEHEGNKNKINSCELGTKLAEYFGLGGRRTGTPTSQDGSETGVFGLFRYGTAFDVSLMLVGSVFSIIMGASLPVLGLIFGEMTDVFIDVTKRGFQNSTHMVNDSIVDTRISEKDFLTYMAVCSVYYGIIAVSAFISSVIQTFCWDYTCERQTYRLRRTYFSQILRQDVSWHELNTHGNLNTKLSEDIERIREGIGSKFGIVIQYISTFATGVLIGLYADWMLTIGLLILFPVNYSVGSFSSRMAAQSAQRELEKYAAASEIANEVLSSIKTVAAYSSERKEHARYSKALYEGRDLAIRKYVSYAFSMFLVNSVTYIAYAIGFFLACDLIKAGYSTPGDVFTVFFSVMMGAFTLGNVIPHLNIVMTAVGAARTVFKIIDRTPSIDAYSNFGSTIQDFKGHIKFEDVTFCYPSRNQVKALSNLDLEITPGSKVAIVGHSGAGKSSIVNLLMRFYDATSGQILLDDKNIKDLKLKWLRRNIGLVSQEPMLFGVSIRDNISYGREDVSHEEIKAAAKLANAHKFIGNLPQGYDTLVGERGGKLSGGQKQRIAIARAVVRQPKILLLDEATSALDYRSEKAVQTALENVMKGRTTIIIAHRLSTINYVDKIYVLKNGFVVESGNHDELMDQKCHYYDLVTSQAQDKSLSKMCVGTRLLAGEPSTSSSADDTDIEDVETPTEIEPRRYDYTFEEKKDCIPLRLIWLQRNEWYLILIGLVMCSFAGSVQPLFAFLYGEIFSTFSLDGPEMDTHQVFWTVMFVFFGLASGISYATWSFSMAKGAEHLIARIRDKTMFNALKQEISWFDYTNCSPSIIINRLARDAPIVKHVAGVRIGQIFSSIAGFATALTIGGFYGWKLALFLLFIAPFVLAGSYWQVSVTRKNIFRDLTLLDKAGKVASECVQNLKTVQALGRESDFVEEYMDLLWEPYRESKHNAFRYGIVYGLAYSINYIMYMVAFYYGSFFIQNGEMTPDDVYRVFFAMSFTAMAVGTSAAYLVDYAKGIASSKMVLDLIDKKSQANPLSPDGEQPEVMGNISFRHVTFSYPTRKDITVLDDFSLDINAGETIALVGESGCGKSTLLALLERFYFPDEGGIYVDDVDISTVNLNYWRKLIGLVTQEPVLFNCSIKENILYGLSDREKENVSHKDLTDAAKMANAHDFITELPQGYNTLCGKDGSKLSGGQKQRIAIARALVRKPKILMLDEATSALDSENERIVQEALDNARAGRTCIIIAHRLSTIENADRIAVLKNGKIVELGLHAPLMAKEGHYYNLYKGQEL
ncbi:ATP-dependent translocase ABCB1 isoform X2 [Halyomorpha halys]|uniref:ATP-dependent translocase ABCB1 isoform X2 n=1 Tax=Halyomorpha halys TaxID=286706 RepID=UPI0006D50299|nr:multidrug resistance protein 1B isoform X2 [Halyomorpha halys]